MHRPTDPKGYLIEYGPTFPNNDIVGHLNETAQFIQMAEPVLESTLDKLTLSEETCHSLQAKFTALDYPPCDGQLSPQCTCF
jgi:hypothetical protein